MQNNVILPQWLDNLIFEKLGAKYQRSNADMTVIDWDKNDVLNYLGTYFPRSYAESYCIFSEFFKQYPLQFVEKRELTVFDFGCGTGGEIIGLLDAFRKRDSYINTINIYALDGNLYALRICENILKAYRKTVSYNIEYHLLPTKIDDKYDLSIVKEILSESIKANVDIFLSFKAICEFASKQQFDKRNPYEHIINVLKTIIHNNGLMCITDVTSYNNVSEEWLPNMLDNAIKDKKVLFRNELYNMKFHVTHSRKVNDVSKVAWRIIE